MIGKRIWARLFLLGFLNLFIFSAPILCRAQATGADSLSGVVRDRSGARVPGAVIRLYGATALAMRAVAASDGRFALASLAPGSYVLEVAAAGFQTFSQRMDLRSEAVSLEVILEVEGVHHRVVVLAADTPETPLEISKAASVISRDELDSRDVFSFTDALRAVPGLQVQQLGGPAGIASLRFRGLRPEDTAVLLDGFRMTDPSDNKGSSRTLLSEITGVRFDRLEILRGAASSLYGTHAVGGVVNAHTRRPQQPRSAFVSFQGGSLGLLMPSAGLSGWSPAQRVSYTLEATHQNYLFGQDVQDASRNSSGNAAAWVDLSPRARLFARFLLADGFSYLNEDPSPLAGLPDLPTGQRVREAVPARLHAAPNPQANFYPQINDPDYHQRVRYYTGAARLDFETADFWRQSLGWQSLRVRRGYDDGPGVAPLAAALGYLEPLTTSRRRYDSTHDQLLWRNTFTVAAADTLYAGIEYERSSLDQTEFGQSTQAIESSSAVQARNQARLLNGRLQLQLGGQAQFYALSAPRFSDSAGNPYGRAPQLEAPTALTADAAAAYFFRATGTKLRAHAGNGYRSPSLYERYGSGGSGFYYGNPLLRPERANFIDAGFDQALWGERVEAKATWFYTRLHTIIDFGSTPADAFGRFFGYLNTRGGSARGAELSVEARPHRSVSVTAGYTYTNSDLPFATAAGTTRVLGISDHQFTAGLLVVPTHRVRFHLQTYAVSDYDFPLFGSAFPFPYGVYRFAGHARLDLTASADLLERQRSRLRYVVRIDNLLNREFYHAGFLAPKATVRTGLKWEF